MDFGAAFGWIAKQLVELVLPGLATAIGGMVVALLSKYLKKVKIELTAEQEARLREIVADAVRSTEEVARRQAKVGVPMSSDEKDDMTAATITAKMPDLPPLELRNAIDAALPQVREELRPSTPATFGRE